MVVSCDADHAELVGDELMRKMHFCPKPADVFEAAERLLERRIGERQEPEEWEAMRKPGDEPFHGIADLVDERLLAILRRKAEQGMTHAERASAKQFLLRYERKRVPAGAHR